MKAITEADLIEDIVDSFAMGELVQSAAAFEITRQSDGVLSVDFGGDVAFLVTVTAYARA